MMITPAFRPFKTIRCAALLVLAAGGLAGCVYYPAGYGHNSGYAVAPSVTVVPPPVVVGGWWGDWGDWGDDD